MDDERRRRRRNGWRSLGRSGGCEAAEYEGDKTAQTEPAMNTPASVRPEDGGSFMPSANVWTSRAAVRRAIGERVIAKVAR